MANMNTLTPAKDYYFNEEGLMVFTAHYLIKRGKCCQSGCLHCPFEQHNSFPSDPMIPKEFNTGWSLDENESKEDDFPEEDF